MRKESENADLSEVSEPAMVGTDVSSRTGTSERASEICARAIELMNRKTKPPGSLGILENLAIRLAGLQRTVTPSLRRKRICVFAGSHGVSEENISAYPSEVTRQMVLNFLSGGAAINVLARHGQIDIHVVDAGVDHEFPRAAGLLDRKVMRGTANFARGPAMSRAEAERCIATGIELARAAKQDGMGLL